MHLVSVSARDWFRVLFSERVLKNEVFCCFFNCMHLNLRVAQSPHSAANLYSSLARRGGSHKTPRRFQLSIHIKSQKH